MSRFKKPSKERRNLEDLIFGSSELKPRTVKRDATSTRRLSFPKAIHPSKVKNQFVVPTRNFAGDPGIVGPEPFGRSSNITKKVKNKRPQT